MPDFNVLLAGKGEIALSAAAKRADKTILWVLRFMGCTTCRYDLYTLKEAYEKFRAQRTQILVVMQSLEEIVLEDTRNDPLPFDVICDPDCEIYDAISIEAAPSKEARMPKRIEDMAVWEHKKKEIQRLGLKHGKDEGRSEQLPAFFVIGQDLAVLYVHYAANSVDMPLPDEALAIVESL